MLHLYAGAERPGALDLCPKAYFTRGHMRLMKGFLRFLHDGNNASGSSFLTRGREIV